MPDDRTPTPPASDQPLTSGPAAAVLWGAFLGCSWTWVIGMVFPAMLLRDYGMWGWVVFAVPNVVGAAAMGVVLFRPELSWKIVTEHTRACSQFTIITVAYHLFVATWLFSKLFGIGAAPMLVIAIALCATIGFKNRRSAMLFVSAAIALLSWGCFSYATRMSGAWSAANWALPDGEATRLGMTDLLLFAPCSLMGFALCPYLDLTFHRARYSTSPGTGAAAFIFGFGVVFASMIVFSVCYGGELLPFINGDPDAELPGYWLVVLAVHVMMQAGFTIVVHVREIIDGPGIGKSWLVVAGGIAIVMGIVSRIEGLPASSITGDLTWGEAGYRAFLLFYGTVFPAYVWLVMIPTRGVLTAKGHSLRNTVFVITGAAGYALGWVAFVLGQSMAIVVIVALFVLARVAVELLPRERA